MSQHTPQKNSTRYKLLLLSLCVKLRMSLKSGMAEPRCRRNRISLVIQADSIDFNSQSGANYRTQYVRKIRLLKWGGNYIIAHSDHFQKYTMTESPKTPWCYEDEVAELYRLIK